MTDQLHNGAPLPPRGQLRWFKIISPTKGRPLSAIIYGDTFTAKWTHYVPPTLPCTETPDCHWCKGGIGSRLNGYIAAGEYHTGQPRVLGLTYGACCQFTELLQKRGTLRGLYVTLSRIYVSDKAPIKVTINKDTDGSKLMEPFDVIDSLSRMWGINAEYLRRGCRRLTAAETTETYLAARLKHEQGRRGDVPQLPEAS